MKLPRDISGVQAVRALQRLGFGVVRQRGSHVRLAKGTLTVTVPAHGEIAPGTLQNILRQAGITVETFCESLR
ncbi:YcfA family protein [Chthoniobacter flavus Ellin428]|uniref:YcfA family protein n=1 Tax=Chthoniobacter flavus Ellin428 TaxID=497964 RepID=B4CWV0_9BACT|nr:type II toxin-antitoxin system HicA family toxin [Chthoniobacter flavus]EDY21270.1 YcfA family protein [Chthoniobacter flavus Ellin428]TCO87637.1 putative RNA binding protein YcfA (HicA-like mRNA interferase family) [Chthoniobacter flavus]